jgi:hypothetical protein
VEAQNYKDSAYEFWKKQKEDEQSIQTLFTNTQTTKDNLDRTTTYLGNRISGVEARIR